MLRHLPQNHWTTTQASEILREIHGVVAAHGYIIGLYGSVPREGAGEDLDLVVFPGMDEKQSGQVELMEAIISECGLRVIWSDKLDCGSIHKAVLGDKKLDIRIVSTLPANRTQPPDFGDPERPQVEAY